MHHIAFTLLYYLLFQLHKSFEFINTNVDHQNDNALSAVQFAPESWDWRTKGALGPVRNQGQLADVQYIVATGQLLSKNTISFFLCFMFALYMKH